MTWSARKRAWEAKRLAAAIERAPERQPRFSTISDTPIERLYGPWSWQPGAGRRPGRRRRPDRRRPPRRPPPAASTAAGTTSTRCATSACPASRRSPAASTRPATAAGSGRCGCSPGFGAAEDTNARFRSLLAAGQTGLSIAYDMPTLYGYDTDDPEAEGEFGTCGVAVSSLADMEVLLDGLPLDKRLDVDDDQLARPPRSGRCTSSRPRRPACRGPPSRARPRTTSSRSSSPRRSSCSRPSRRCAS